MSTSNLERKFKLYWRAMGGPALDQEHQFHTTRKWRFDFAIPEIRVAIEVEGGTYGGGRHSRGVGFSKDCEKYNTAALLGWTVFKFDCKTITERKHIEPVIKHVQELLAKRKEAA